MAVSPDAVSAGRCFLTVDGKVRRVVSITPDGKVIFTARLLRDKSGEWPFRIAKWERPTRENFAKSVERAVALNASKGRL